VHALGTEVQYFHAWAMWHTRCCPFGVETTWPRADQDTDLDKEGTEMKATWIPVSSAVAIILLSLGVLEVMSAGVRVDEPGPAARWFSDAPMHSELTPDDLLALDLGTETGETIHSADGYER
jgi:hypothetical protein